MVAYFPSCIAVPAPPHYTWGANMQGGSSNYHQCDQQYFRISTIKVHPRPMVSQVTELPTKHRVWLDRWHDSNAMVKPDFSLFHVEDKDFNAGVHRSFREWRSSVVPRFCERLSVTLLHARCSSLHRKSSSPLFFRTSAVISNLSSLYSADSESVTHLSSFNGHADFEFFERHEFFFQYRALLFWNYFWHGSYLIQINRSLEHLRMKLYGKCQRI